MPASPIGVKLKEYPSRWKWKQDVIIPDQGDSGTFFKIWYEQKKDDWYAWLMWCPSDELLDEHGEDNWHHVEELTIESIGVLNTIEMVLDISFHDRIIEITLPSGPVAIGRGETWDGE